MAWARSQISNTIKHYSISLFIAWTVVASLSVGLNLYDLRQEVLREATAEARAHLEMNVAYRKVIGRLGGVYVSTRNLAPNPYMTVPNRDLVTRDGETLTLINAAYLIRVVFETMQDQGDRSLVNKMVSLNPLNPVNTPDPWEAAALREFSLGATEASDLANINGTAYLRIIQPFSTEEGCMKCHGAQGYRVGDVRGGISIAVPMGSYFANEAKTRRTIIATHGILWFAVSCGLFVYTRKRREHEQQVLESAWRFRVLSDAAKDWIFWLDPNSRFSYISPSCSAFTGYSPGEFTKDPGLLISIIHPDDRELWRRHISDFQEPEHDEMEMRIVTRNGEIKWVSHVCAPIVVDGKFLGRRASNRDITDRWKLGEQLRQAQKMEAVGLLAGGVAHDFNNILTAIIGYGNILKLKIPQEDPLSRNVEQILTSSARAASLTQSLLTFSRKQTINPREVDLNAIVGRFDKFLARILREDIALTIVPAEAPLVIMADQGQVEQILMNLATNARDAMPQGGRLTVTTSRFVMDEHFVRAQGFGRAGTYAVLAMTDTGAGMDESIRARIFDPFFTTKEVGRGTGLGLAMVYGAVQQNNGFITVASEPGQGTTFTIYFPLLKEPETGADAPAADAWERGTGTILIAEDDPVLRKLSGTVLNEFGYTTIEAVDGEEAIALFRKRQDEIQLVILDVIMPKKNGKEVYEELKKMQPGLKALFMSGYTADIVREKGVLEQDIVFLAKPIAPQALLKKVRALLGRQS